MRFLPVYLSLLTAATAATVPDRSLTLIKNLQSSVNLFEQYIKGNVSMLGPTLTAQQKSQVNSAVVQSLQTIATASNSTLQLLKTRKQVPVSAKESGEIHRALVTYTGGVQSTTLLASSAGLDDPIESIVYFIGGIIADILEHIDPEL